MKFFLTALLLALAPAGVHGIGSVNTTGIEQDWPQANIDANGWTQCYSGVYNVNEPSDFEFGEMLRDSCGSQTYVMIGCRPPGATNWQLVGWGHSAKAFTNTGFSFGSLGIPLTEDENIQWYYHEYFNFGFAPPGSSVWRNAPCDVRTFNGTQQRMCWNLYPDASGWNCGHARNLTNDDLDHAYERAAWTTNCIGVDCPPTPAPTPAPPSQSPSRSVLEDTGIEQDWPQVNIDADGWTQCYSGVYNAGEPTGSEFGEMLRHNCGSQTYVMLGCRPPGAPKWQLVGWGHSAAAFTDTGYRHNNDVVTVDGNIQWYYNDDRSFGFSPPGLHVDKSYCDVETSEGDKRLCWNMEHYGLPGFRCGHADRLMFSNDLYPYERAAWTANCIGVDCPPTEVPSSYPSRTVFEDTGIEQYWPQANVNSAGWTQCYSGVYDANEPSGSEFGEMLRDSCGSQTYVMLGCRPSGVTTWQLVGWGHSAAAFTDTGFDNGQATLDGNIQWYFNDHWSFGFSPPGLLVKKLSCDRETLQGDQRMCWHLGDTSQRGWNCGYMDDIGRRNHPYLGTFERAAWTADCIGHGCPTSAPSGVPTVVPSPYPSRSVIEDTSIEQDWPQANIDADGWTQCYSGVYNVNDPSGSEFGEMLRDNCGSQTYVMIGCRPPGATNWQLVGWGHSAAAFTNTGFGASGLVTVDGNIQWYYNEDYSFGFSPPGSSVWRPSGCDVNGSRGEGDKRMCWSLLDTTPTGWNCGRADRLHVQNDDLRAYDRAAWMTNCIGGDCPPTPARTPGPPSPSPSRSVLEDTGIEQDWPQANIDADGWTQCYSGIYNVNEPSGSEFGEMLRDNCGSQTYVMLGCRPPGATNWQLVGWGHSAAAFTDTGNSGGGLVTVDGNIQWYYHEDWSFGFTPSGLPVWKSSCDVLNKPLEGDKRMCWNLNDRYQMGWNCGHADALVIENDDLRAYDRAAWTADCIGGDCTPAPTGIPSRVPSGVPTVAPSPYPSRSVLEDTGIEQDWPQANIDADGWTQCYSGVYNVNEPTGNEFGETLRDNCGSQTYVMIGCRPPGATNWQLVGWGHSAKAFTNTGFANSEMVTVDGNIQWYYHDHYSFGFSPPGLVVTKSPCDVNITEGEQRMCWNLEDMSGIGFRCGNQRGLQVQFSNKHAFDRAAWMTNCIGSDCPQVRRLGEGVSEEAAKIACAHLRGKGRAFSGCVDDVTAMNDLDQALSGAY